MKVLIVTDGSTFSQASLKKLCPLIAAVKDAEIKILSVYSRVLPVDEFTPSAEYSEKLEKAQKAQAESAAEQAAETIRRCLPGPNLDLTTEISVGNPPPSIVETAEVLRRGFDRLETAAARFGFRCSGSPVRCS